MPSGRSISSPEMPHQPRRAGQKRHPAQQRGGEAEVGQGGAGDARAVDRQLTAGALAVDLVDHAQRAQVGPSVPVSWAIS